MRSKVFYFILVCLIVIIPANAFASESPEPTIVDKITVNGRPISAPSPIVDSDNELIMLPLRAIAEALGLVVEWDALERRVDIGGVYSVWVDSPTFISSRGVMAAHKFYDDAVIVDSRTFISISFFNYVMSGISAEVDDGVVIIERQSLFWNVTEFPELNLKFWSYNLATHADMLYEYETLYNAVTHEGGSTWVIWTDTTIRNFEFIEVGLGEMGIEMLYFYPGQTLHAIEEFTPERPFAFRSHFGTMPRIAITFLDENDVRLYFTIQQSGKDGSLLIMKFPLDVPNPF